jgi:hypothetical protein
MRGNAEQASLTRMSNCVFDFRLSDDGQIELAGIGEATEEYVMETCYPELQKTLDKAEGTDSEDSQKQIREAVERERKRLWDNQPPAKPAATELGREIQKQLGAPSVVVDRIARQIASKRLKSKEGEGKKPN